MVIAPKEAFKYAKQANARTREASFRKFAEQKQGSPLTGDHPEAKFISGQCGVIALRLIDSSPDAIAKWEALDSEYQSWARAGG